MLHRFLVLSLLLVVSMSAAAQFSPGNKSGGGNGTEYRKVSGAGIRPRLSKKGVPVKSDTVAGMAKKNAGKGAASKKAAKVKKEVKKPVKKSEKRIDSIRYSAPEYSLGDRVIMQGDSGKDVRTVATILVKKLYMSEDSIIYTNDGGVLYEGELVRAVKYFQRFNGFYEDGIIGPTLIKALRKRKN